MECTDHLSLQTWCWKLNVKLTTSIEQKKKKPPDKWNWKTYFNVVSSLYISNDHFIPFFSLVYHITNYSRFQGHWFKDSRSFDKCVQFCLISRIWNIDSIDFYSLSIIHNGKYILIIFLRTIGNIYAPSLEEGSVSKLWLHGLVYLYIKKYVVRWLFTL